MPEAVCDSRKSGVECNVLGRLLTLTCIHVLFFFYKECSIIIYLRGEVRLPGNLFLTARPRIPITNNVNKKLILILIFFSHTREHHGITLINTSMSGVGAAEKCASERVIEAAEILEVKSCSIARKGNGLEQISCTAIEEAIRNTFGGSGIVINVCTKEIKVPSINDRYKIIEECHSSTTGGHLGIAKTYHSIRDRFYWEGIKLDVQEFVRSCGSCQKTKLTRRKGKEPMKITDTPRKAFDKIQIDSKFKEFETKKSTHKKTTKFGPKSHLLFFLFV